VKYDEACSQYTYSDCSSLNRNEFSLGLEYIGNADFERKGDFEGEEYGWIGVAVFYAHDGLPAHSHAHCELLLSHALFESESSNAVFHGHGGHSGGGGVKWKEKTHQSFAVMSHDILLMIFFRASLNTWSFTIFEQWAKAR